MNQPDRDSCPRYTPTELARFLDGDLSPRRTRDLLRHLPQCPTCRQRLREFEALRDALRSAPALRLPKESFALSPRDLPARRKVLWYPFLRTVTAAVAALVLVFFLASLLVPAAFEPAFSSPAKGERPHPPAVVEPAITRRTPPSATGLVTALPAHLTVTPVLAGTAYPSPLSASPHTSMAAIPQNQAAPPGPESPAWPLMAGLRLGGLLLLGLVAGLTWLAYRRERAFLA